MVGTVWLDGSLVPAAEARVSVLDHGLTVGDGIFEALLVRGGRPFAVRRHLDRLERSAAGMDLELPDRSVIERAAAEVVGGSGLDEGKLRITVTAGIGPLGSGRGDGPPTVLVAVEPLGPVAAVADVLVVPWPRNERGALAGLKTTSYAENVLALRAARAAGASEAIFGNTVGHLCEGTASNVVLGVGGRLVTPPLSSGCLAGVTRALVLEVCDVAEEPLPLSALAAADEAFLTSTIRDVQPVDTVDGIALPAAPGPLTSAATAAFAALVARDTDP